MTQAETLLIAAANLTRAARSGKPVEVSAEVVAELAYFLESCGRTVAKAGHIDRLDEPRWVEHAHDIARTQVGALR